MKNVRRISYFDLIGFLTIMILAAAPLYLGGNRPLPESALALSIGFVLMLWILGAVFRRPLINWPKAVVFSGCMLLLVMIWCVLQTVSWMPESWNHPVWDLLADFEMDVEPRIAIDALSPIDGLIGFASPAGMFLLCFLLSIREHRCRHLLHAIIFIAAVYAALGLIMALIGWRPFEELQEGSITSTFVNRNHFATYLNIAIFAALSVIFVGHRPSDGPELGLRTLSVQGIANTIERSPLVVISLGVIIVALIGTLSRGGFLSLLVGFFMMGWLGLNATKRSGRQTIVTVFGFMLVLAVMMAFIGPPLLERFDDVGAQGDLDVGGRISGWVRTVELIELRPWLGYGHRTYFNLFMMHTDERFAAIFHHAHNDYLEAIVELGMPAAGLLLLAMISLLLHVANLAGSTKTWRCRASTAAALAIIVVGFHAMFDFSLTIPAVSITFAGLLGIGSARVVAG